MARETVWATLVSYFEFYWHYIMQRWDSISPMEYGILLIAVWIFGWMLMKSVDRK